MLKTKDLEKKNKTELQDLLMKTKKDMESATEAVFVGKSKDTSKAKKFRKDIARINAVLSSKAEEKLQVSETESK